MSNDSDLARRQAEVWARALHAVCEALWQHHGQPTDEGYARIRGDAEVAARAAFQVAITDADLFSSGGWRARFGRQRTAAARSWPGDPAGGDRPGEGRHPG